jgi:hypothetical protein
MATNTLSAALIHQVHRTQFTLAKNASRQKKAALLHSKANMAKRQIAKTRLSEIFIGGLPVARYLPMTPCRPPFTEENLSLDKYITDSSALALAQTFINLHNISKQA